MPAVLGAPGLPGEFVAGRAPAEQAGAGGMRSSLSDVDRIVHPHGAVEGRGVETTRRGGGEGDRGGVSRRVRSTRRVKGAGRPRRPTREEALDAAHQDVEGGSGVALAEVGRGEAAHEAVDAEAAHGLVAEAET